MTRQNEFFEGFSKQVDLRVREDEIVGQVHDELNFVPDEIVSRSTWWGSERVGAFQCAGTYENKPVILKIQGVEPSVSEIDAIEGFNAAAAKSGVRAPYLYASQRWDSAKGYELLLIERISSDKLIHLPASINEVKKFFELYNEYSKNVQPTPWIDEPSQPYAESVRQKVHEQQQASRENYPDHPLRRPGDDQIISSAVELITRFYTDVELSFQHCHITTDDVFLPNGDDPRFIYTSNIVWGWKPKFYDALMAYHHFPRLLIERGENVTKEMVAEQTNWWQEEIFALPNDDDEQRHLRVVMLELAVNRLTIDDLTLDPDNPLDSFLVESTRETIRNLMAELSK